MNREELLAEIRRRGYITTADNITFYGGDPDARIPVSDGNAAVLNELFDRDVKAWMKGKCSLESNKWVWFPKMEDYIRGKNIQKSGMKDWHNILINPDTIVMYSTSKPFDTWQPEEVGIFATFGTRERKFIGVFTTVGGVDSKTIRPAGPYRLVDLPPNGRVLKFERIATKMDLPKIR